MRLSPNIQGNSIKLCLKRNIRYCRMVNLLCKWFMKRAISILLANNVQFNLFPQLQCTIAVIIFVLMAAFIGSIGYSLSCPCQGKLRKGWLGRKGGWGVGESNQPYSLGPGDIPITSCRYRPPCWLTFVSLPSWHDVGVLSDLAWHPVSPKWHKLVSLGLALWKIPCQQ